MVQPPNFLRAFDIREGDEKPTAERGDYCKKWGWHMWNANIGVAAVGIVIANVPYSFNGQHEIGCIYYFINLLLLILNITMTIRRAANHPQVFKQSFFDHNEAVWFPVTGITLATFIILTTLYGVPNVGPWLAVVCEVLFYIHVVYAVVIALTIEFSLRTVPRPLRYMGPSDALDSYPLMFIGVVAGTLAPEVAELSPSRALTIIILGYIGQGLGFFIGLLKLAVWMTRKMVFGRAPPQIIPTYVIAIGVPGFTSFSLLTLGNACMDVFPANDFMSGASGSFAAQDVAQVFFFAGVWFSFLLIGMASWLMLVYFGWWMKCFFMEPTKDPRQRWQLTWWSWCFPLTGVVVSFARYATWLPSRAFGVISIIFVFWMATMSIINLIGTAHMMIIGKLPGTADEFEAIQRATNNGERPSPADEAREEDAQAAAALFGPPRV